MPEPSLIDHANDFFAGVEAVIADGVERKELDDSAVDQITDIVTPLRRWFVRVSEILERE